MQTYCIDFLENESMEVVTIHKRSIKDCNLQVFLDYCNHPFGLANIFRLDKDFNKIEVVF